MYADGRGVPQDYVQAYAHFSLAADQSDDDARSCMESLEAVITCEQLAEARQRAREWRARHVLIN
jgi:TPR repeat protein